jgi:YgiT-type zinc finger domain-containing protein
MMCPICRQGETQLGTTTVTLERRELTFVAKDVPALVCANLRRGVPGLVHH